MVKKNLNISICKNNILIISIRYLFYIFGNLIFLYKIKYNYIYFYFFNIVIQFFKCC